MSTPTDPSRDELRTLRERAYGPAADIHDDPVALLRLHELEGAARRAPIVPATPTSSPSADWPTDASPLAAAAGIDLAEPGPPPGVSVPAAPVAAESAGAEPVAAKSVAAESAAAESAPTSGDDDASAAAAAGRGIPDSPEVTDATTDASARRPWWRRRIPLLWAGSVVAALLLGVGLTLGVQTLGAGKVATLSVDPDGEWPPEMFGWTPPDNVIFEEFHGVRVMAYSQALDVGDVQRCLYVVSGDPLGRIGAGGCGADAFPPTASLQVTPGAPEELRDAFAMGTALQFVLDGDHVHVYARAPQIVRPTP